MVEVLTSHEVLWETLLYNTLVTGHWTNLSRYHTATAEHKTKQDYEAMALAKAEAKGPKEVMNSILYGKV